MITEFCQRIALTTFRDHEATVTARRRAPISGPIADYELAVQFVPVIVSVGGPAGGWSADSPVVITILST